MTGIHRTLASRSQPRAGSAPIREQPAKAMEGVWDRPILPPPLRSGPCYFGTQTSLTSSCPRGHRRFASADPANITVRNDSAMTAAKIFFAIHSPPLVIPSVRVAFDRVPDVGNPDARFPDTERRAD